ncbi:MAG TPA: NAD(P)-dependent oxidoreductase [Pirellulales bacterium]|jgi:nucleoside-diphosphate-sugar epimerase|nr:NAD(P)-dependent oxidoreductase [Pirellulales bacterium]
MSTPERILVTGGSGFVGACLVRELIAQGHEVHLLLRDRSSSWRLAGIEGEYQPHEADLRDISALRRAVDASRPEVIYHLAAYGVRRSQTRQSEILETNLQGTANLLEALGRHDYRALVHTGSSSEYGHKNHAMRENDRLEPRTAYAVSKAAATLLCQAEAYRGRMVSTVRIFSAYGPWEDPHRLVAYVVDCCRRGEAPRVTNGAPPRDFIFVDDVLRLLQTAAHCPQAAGRILHAGSGRQCNVREMIRTIVEVCGRDPADIRFGEMPAQADEPTHWVANIEQTTKLTGWRPIIGLRRGIEQTLAWAQSHALSERHAEGRTNRSAAAAA